MKLCYLFDKNIFLSIMLLLAVECAAGAGVRGGQIYSSSSGVVVIPSKAR